MTTEGSGDPGKYGCYCHCYSFLVLLLYLCTVDADADTDHGIQTMECMHAMRRKDFRSVSDEIQGTHDTTR